MCLKEGKREEFFFAMCTPLSVCITVFTIFHPLHPSLPAPWHTHTDTPRVVHQHIPHKDLAPSIQLYIRASYKDTNTCRTCFSDGTERSHIVNNTNDDEGGRSATCSPSNSIDSRASFGSAMQSKTSYDSVNTAGAYSEEGSVRNGGGGHHHQGAGSSRGSGSGSDLYSEDESDNSDSYADGAGHQRNAAAAASGRNDFLRESEASPSGGSRREPVASPTSRHAAATRRQHSAAPGAHRISASDTPLSYFHCHSCAAFSIRNEVQCYVVQLKHLFRIIEEDRLPWKTDFADVHKLRLPRKMKEVAGRLNLNIPYYASNYVELFYVVTMPFLFFYNTPFFLVTLVTAVMIHSVTLRRKNTQVYGESVTILGRSVTYRNLAHVLLFAFAMLFMFFNGLRTMVWVIVLNMSIIVPHSVIRTPTYFDDEDLEKCRPKLAQYAIVLLLLALDYLEGDVSDNDDTESRRLIERERKRLAAVLEKREGKE